MRIDKPLGIKAYGHIPHLPGSRMGPADHHCHEGQARICTEKVRDRHDRITVTEKLDGTCVAVAKIEGQVRPLVRAGYRAESSPQENHRLFAEWVYANYDRFDRCLRDGERLVGEWLALAHGTLYHLPHEPFAAFDLMRGPSRASWEELSARISNFVLPHILHSGGSISIESICEIIRTSNHGAVDAVEGAVWRVERQGKFDFLAKWVRPDKVDGKYLPEISGEPPIWNWKPQRCRCFPVAEKQVQA